MIVDMPYLPYIVEGEVHILFVGEEPIFVMHKKPAEGGGLSVPLFSGAQYIDEEPER